MIKKSIKFLSFLLFVGLSIVFLYANNIDFVYFEPEINEGEINMTNIYVDLDNYVENFCLKRSTGVDDWIIWGNYNFVKINDKTGFDSYFLDNQKTLCFDGNFSGNLTIKGTKIRVYKDKIRNAKLNLVVDGEILETTTKGLYSDENRDNRDTMKPLSIQTGYYYLSGGDLYIYWTRSPDLDIQRYMIEVYSGNKILKQDYTQANEFSYKLEGIGTGNYDVYVYAKDLYYTSLKLALTNSFKENKEDEVGQEEDYNENGTGGLILSKDNYTNWYFMDYNIVFDKIADKFGEMIEMKLEKLSLIDLKKTIDYRNNMLKLLDKFFNKKINKSDLIDYLFKDLHAFVNILK